MNTFPSKLHYCDVISNKDSSFLFITMENIQYSITKCCVILINILVFWIIAWSISEMKKRRLRKKCLIYLIIQAKISEIKNVTYSRTNQKRSFTSMFRQFLKQYGYDNTIWQHGYDNIQLKSLFHIINNGLNISRNSLPTFRFQMSRTL